MYILWFYSWGDGVMTCQLWRKSKGSWVVLADHDVDTHKSGESDSWAWVMVRLAPWLSVFSGAALMASNCPGLHCWYCPCWGWLLLEWLLSLCCGQLQASPLFPHLKQRPSAHCLWYSSADRQLSSIVLGLFMGLFSWGVGMFGWYSFCFGLNSGFQVVVWSPWFCFLNEKRRLSVAIAVVCSCSKVLNLSHRSLCCMSFFKLWGNSHGSAWFPFILARSAVWLNSWVWSLHEVFCLISMRCCCILCVLDRSINFPRNSWANVSQLVSVTGCVQPALIFSVQRVSQWAFHKAAFESSLIHAKAQAIRTLSFGKLLGCNVQYMVHAVINLHAFSPGVLSNSGLGALIVDQGASGFWAFWFWTFWFNKCTRKPWALINTAQYRSSVSIWLSITGCGTSTPSMGASIYGRFTWFWKLTNADMFARPVHRLMSSCWYWFTSCAVAVGGVVIMIWGMAHAWGFRLAIMEFYLW